jgi:hypothetical protein
MHKYLVRRFVKKSRKKRTASKNFTHLSQNSPPTGFDLSLLDFTWVNIYLDVWCRDWFLSPVVRSTGARAAMMAVVVLITVTAGIAVTIVGSVVAAVRRGRWSGRF